VRQRIARLLWAERRFYLTGAIFVFLSTLTALAYPYVVQLILDDAIGKGQIQKLTQLSLMMVGILVVESAATVGRDYCFGIGAERVVLGTAAIRDQGLVREAAAAYPRRIVLALDAKDGLVATDGWLAVSTRTAVEVVRELADLPIAAILYTDIARDGTRTGPNIEATARLAKDGGLPVLASGGIAKLDDLRCLAKRARIAGAIVGRALYEKALTIEEAVQAAESL